MQMVHSADIANIRHNESLNLRILHQLCYAVFGDPLYVFLGAE